MMSDDGTVTEDSAIYQWGKNFFEGGKDSEAPLSGQLNTDERQRLRKSPGELFGTSPTSPRHLKQWMEDAGFVDVQEHVLKIPIGPWPKDLRLKQIGLFEQVNMTQGVNALSVMLFTRALKWSVEEVELFLMDVRKDVKDRRLHTYYNLCVLSTQSTISAVEKADIPQSYVVFGRKPE